MLSRSFLRWVMVSQLVLTFCVFLVRMEPAQAFPGMIPGFAAYSAHRVSFDSDAAGVMRADGDALASPGALRTEAEVLVPFSAKEDIRKLTLGWADRDDIQLTNVVFGITENKLIFAERDSHCAAGSRHVDNYDIVDYVVEDTWNLPQPIQINAMGTNYEVYGFELAADADGSAFVASLAGRPEGGEPFVWTLADSGGSMPLGAPCKLAVTGACNDDWCTTNCSIDAADCDRCDCGGTGFCTDGTTAWGCAANNCFAPDVCVFQAATCTCGCFGGQVVGACCLEDAGCIEMPVQDCALQHGSYAGEFTNCGDDPCPPPAVYGACCDPASGVPCAEMKESECAELGGLFEFNTPCADANCGGTGQICPLPDPADQEPLCAFLATSQCLTVATDETCLPLRVSVDDFGHPIALDCDCFPPVPDCGPIRVTPILGTPEFDLSCENICPDEPAELCQVVLNDPGNFMGPQIPSGILMPGDVIWCDCPTQTEACCFIDGSCQDLRPQDCIDQQGTPSPYSDICLGDGDGDGVDDACECPCDGDINGDGLTNLVDFLIWLQCYEQPPVGACFRADLNCDGLINIDDFASFHCLFYGFPPEVCCEQATGPCCLPTEECRQVPVTECAALGGTAYPLFNVCGALVPEACCLPDLDCVMADPFCCEQELGGTPQGQNTDCLTPCPEQTGACCDHAQPGGACVDGLTEFDCLDGSGFLQPDWFKDMTCAEVESQGLCLEHLGACCDHSQPGGFCVSGVPESECAPSGDVFWSLSQSQFEDFMSQAGKMLKGVETFEESNIPDGGKVPLPDPLQGNVPNVHANGLGFPNGLTEKNLIIQANVFPGPNPPHPEPSGDPFALYVIGPNFLGSNSEKVGEDLFNIGMYASLDLLFTEPNHTGVGFELSRFGDFPLGGWHLTVYDEHDEEISKFLVPAPPTPEPGKTFVGVWSSRSIGRINIFDEAGPVPDAIDNIQMWVGGEHQMEWFKGEDCMEDGGTVDCLEHTGACCDGTTGICLDGVPESECPVDPSDPNNQYRWEKGILCGELVPPCAEHTGACCDGTTGVCQDGVPESLCPVDPTDPNNQYRWEKGMLCGDLVPPCEEHTGACCDGTSGICLDGVAESECPVDPSDPNNRYRWEKGLRCIELVPPCEPEVGACCLDLEAGPLVYETCVEMDEDSCVAQGGFFQGLGTQCEIEACCLPDGYCDNADPACCVASGGTPQGPGSQCTEPQACCLPGGLCAMLDPLCCMDLDGIPQEPGTICTEEQPCCLPDGSCEMVDPLCCDELGGHASPGNEPICLNDNNNNGVDDACEVPQPLQACCLPLGNCADLTHNDCVAAGGDPQGPGVLCDIMVGECNRLKWAQPPTFNPLSEHPECFWGWDEPSLYGSPQWIVADDWFCERPDPLTDIHWWGSYENWEGIGPPDSAPGSFHIGIWTDVPAGMGLPFSHPGVMLHQWVVPRSALNERSVACDYHPDHMADPDGCFRYDFRIPEGQWFQQEPGEHIYWLSISARYEGSGCQCNGDVNGDGMVNITDVSQVMIHFGCPVGAGIPECDASDVNCDGDVDDADLQVLQCQFGTWPPDPSCCAQSSENLWGWKTREHFFSDDAVRIFAPTAPVPGMEFIMGEPIEEPIGVSWDMAFVLTTPGVCNWDCVWDVDFSGQVRVPDLIVLLSCWGPLGPEDPAECFCLDIDESGSIRVPDLIALLAEWGTCP